ncbi:MAG: glucoamylase [Acidipropionibacterium jensenii]|nr:glucoamylase [Acidipropionibacterium jensenii]
MSAPQWPGPDDRPGTASRSTIEQDAPPRRRGGWVMAVSGVLVVAALAVAAWRVSRDPQTATGGVSPSAVPTSTRATPVPIAPTATSAVSSIPFVTSTGSAKGRWTIKNVSWSSTGVTLTMTLQVTAGTLSSYSFYLMENGSTEVHSPESKGWSDDIANGTIRAGETVSGRVFIPCPKVDSTVMLVRGAGFDPVTALTISA